MVFLLKPHIGYNVVIDCFLAFEFVFIDRSTSNDIHCCWEALFQENRLVVFVWKIHTKINELNNHWKRGYLTAISIFHIRKKEFEKKLLPCTDCMLWGLVTRDLRGRLTAIPTKEWLLRPYRLETLRLWLFRPTNTNYNDGSTWINRLILYFYEAIRNLIHNATYLWINRRRIRLIWQAGDPGNHLGRDVNPFLKFLLR